MKTHKTVYVPGRESAAAGRQMVKRSDSYGLKKSDKLAFSMSNHYFSPFTERCLVNRNRQPHRVTITCLLFIIICLMPPLNCDIGGGARSDVKKTIQSALFS